jgi:hypothetical protein
VAAIEARTVTNNFPRLASNFPGVVSTIIRKTTLDVYAKSQITVPVRKDQRKVKGGALKNSGQVETEEFEGTVSYNIYYSVYVHEGTRFMTARPFLENAKNDTLPAMIAAFSSLESRML